MNPDAAAGEEGCGGRWGAGGEGWLAGERRIYFEGRPRRCELVRGRRVRWCRWRGVGRAGVEMFGKGMDAGSLVLAELDEGCVYGGYDRVQSELGGG